MERKIVLAAAATVLVGVVPLAQAADPQSGVTYSESIGVNTPDRHIVGTTAGREKGISAAGADEQLLDNVLKALVDDTSLNGADIRVRVENGVVTLNGTAKDTAQVEHARSIAQGAAKDATVTSNLRAKA